MDMQNFITATATEAAESKAGCRYSELSRLPYLDAPKMLTIDLMHNLFLGTFKEIDILGFYFFRSVRYDAE